MVAVALIAIVLVGCSGGPEGRGKPQLTAFSEGLGRTIGSVAEVVAFKTVAVDGYGLVAGLAGTGSRECPYQIREYLKQNILRQLPKLSKISAEELIRSRDTAVVKIDGLLHDRHSETGTGLLQLAGVGGAKELGEEVLLFSLGNPDARVTDLDVNAAVGVRVRDV